MDGLLNVAHTLHSSADLVAITLYCVRGGGVQLTRG